MKKKIILYLVSMTLCLCLIISLLVSCYTNIETNKLLNEYKIDALDHIKGYISILDKNLLNIESEIFSQYSSNIYSISDELDQYKNPADISDDQLRAIANKYSIEEIYLINKNGIVFKTTYKNDLNLNLFNVSSDIKNFLNNTYGKGTPLTHRALVSQHNKFNKFLYYSPKDSDYIIEISVDIKSYIKHKYGDSYLNYIFNDTLKNYNDSNEFITNIDIYDVTNYTNWSILQSNNRLDKDRDFIRSIDSKSGLTIKQGSKIKFYYIIRDSKEPGIYLGKSLLIEADYDFSSIQKLSKDILLLSILSVLLMGTIILGIISRFINTHYIKRILKINKNLNIMEQGLYPEDFSFSENDEISEIALNMNKMKEKIMDRELQLKNKLIELEKATLALKESQEKLEYDKLKNEFFANISHEFKTPLNILLSSLQLLDLYRKNGAIIDESDKLKHYTKGMHQNCYRLLRLINNLIDITKIDSSFFNMEPHNHDIVAIVEDIVRSTKEYAKFKCINLNFYKYIPKKITACDPDIIERIVLNLLSNAIKFSLEGGHIDVRIFEKDNSMYITVKDDGIGIPADKQQLIFERFRQVDKSFTRNTEGSGIGLSLVKALVEMHNGSISVKSEYEKGSEFTVVIPIVVLDEPDHYSPPALFHDAKVEKMNIEFSDIYC